MSGADLVVEDLGRRARQRLEAGLLQAGQVLGQRDLGAARPLGHLQRGEAVDVDVGRAGAHRLEHVQVVVAVEVGVDAALQADLGGALVDRLHHAPRDLVELQQVRRPAQVERERPLGEGAEAALERADVRVVDVAVAHEGHVVAGDVAAQVVGHLGHQAHLGAAGAEQRDDLRLAHLLAQGHAGQHLGHGTAAGRGTDRRHACARVAGASSSGGGGSSPPEHHDVSRASPSASDASMTGKRSAGSSQRAGSRAKVG